MCTRVHQMGKLNLIGKVTKSLDLKKKNSKAMFCVLSVKYNPKDKKASHAGAAEKR